MKYKYKFIDLFAGIGGFHIALKEFAECIFVSEWDKNALKTYGCNFDLNNCIVTGDITDFPVNEIPDHDILCAGFPCQPFSIAGEQKGFSHIQGNLFFNIVNILEIKKPKVFILENVKNLQSHDKGNTFKIICNYLKSLGYSFKYSILNSCKYGNIPQNRERIFIVGFLNENQTNKFQFPDQIFLTKHLFGDIIKLNDKKQEKYYQKNINSPSVVKMLEGVTEKRYIYQYRRYYMRKIKTGLCPTLTANMGSGGHNVPLLLDDFGVRKLTPKECFLIQGFPDNFILPSIADSHLYHQSGNAVPPTLVNRIFKNILEVLNEN